MPVYVEMVKDKKSKKLVEKVVDGQKQYFIRTYITDENGIAKQITRHNKEWLGRDGKKEAEFEESKLRTKTFSKTKNILFEELCELYLEEHKKINKESTYYTYMKLINKWIVPYFQNKKTTSLTLNDFINWHNNQLLDSISLNMRNKCHSTLSNILDYGIRYRYVNENFEKTLGAFKEKNEVINEDKGKIRYITYEQFKKFISVVNDEKWNTFFTVLYYTGMRKGEVQALQWKDINFNLKQINVTKTLTVKTIDSIYKITNTKTKENRKIDIDDYLLNVLKKFYNSQKKKNDFKETFFVFGDDKPLPSTTIDRYKHKFFKKSGIDEITIHEFRHSHVSLIINKAIENNLNMSAVFVMLSERMGHTIEVMQKIYMHLFPNIQNEVINIMNNLEKQDQKQDQIK